MLMNANRHISLPHKKHDGYVALGISNEILSPIPPHTPIALKCSLQLKGPESVYPICTPVIFLVPLGK